MIKPTLDDYRAAEDILRNKHDVYSFRGPWLDRNKSADREPAVEAALIDILLSHDNEGGRLIFTGHFPKNISRMQHRLHHIRRHTDPDFFRHDVQEFRRERNEFAFLTESSVMPRTAEHIESTRYGALHLIESALKTLEGVKKEFPHLKTLNWQDDTDEAYKEMVGSTGLIEEDENSSDKEFNIASYFTSVDLCDGDDRYIMASVLPLLREGQMDELARHAVVIIEANYFDDAERKFPHISAMLDNYDERCVAMQRERPILEGRLANFNTDSITKANDVRQSDIFEKFDRIGMFADPSLLEIVKRIVAERAEENDLVKTARFSRKPNAGLRFG